MASSKDSPVTILLNEADIREGVDPDYSHSETIARLYVMFEVHDSFHMNPQHNLFYDSSDRKKIIAHYESLYTALVLHIDVVSKLDDAYKSKYSSVRRGVMTEAIHHAVGHLRGAFRDDHALIVGRYADPSDMLQGVIAAVLGGIMQIHNLGIRTFYMSTTVFTQNRARVIADSDKITYIELNVPHLVQYISDGGLVMEDLTSGMTTIIKYHLAFETECTNAILRLLGELRLYEILMSLP